MKIAREHCSHGASMIRLSWNRPKEDNAEMFWKLAFLGRFITALLKSVSQKSVAHCTLPQHSAARVHLCSCWRVSTLLALANCCLHSWSPFPLSLTFVPFFCGIIYHSLSSYLLCLLVMYFLGSTDNLPFCRKTDRQTCYNMSACFSFAYGIVTLVYYSSNINSN